MTTSKIILTSIFLMWLHFAASSQITGSQLVNKEAKTKNAVETAVDEMMKEPDLKNASFSFYAVDILSGNAIVEYNSDLSLVPASVMKLVTTAVAMEMLGKNYRFTTTLEYDGKIDSLTHILHGNLYIKGGGDPTLGSERFHRHYYEPLFWDKWSDTIKKLGIDSIHGAVVADATVYSDEIAPPTWVWGDIANHYGAGPCGLTVYDNVYKLKFRTGPNNGDSTFILGTEPLIPLLTFENYVKASNTNSDNCYIYGEPYSDLRRVRGSIPKGKSEFIVKGSIPDPPYLAAIEFNNSLKNNGIGTTSPPTSIRRMKAAGTYRENERKILYKAYSPQLKYIIQLINENSINLWAEHLLCAIGKQKYPQGGTNEGSKALEQFIASIGIDASGLYINDGSGLSRHSAITTRQIASLMLYMKTKSKNSDDFYKSLAIAGKSGTLKKMCVGTIAENNIHGKSGTMTRVRAYAGYATTQSKKEVAFAMIVNNYNCTANEMRDKLEKLLVKLAELKN